MRRTASLLALFLVLASTLAAQAPASPGSEAYVLKVGTTEDLDSLSPFNAYERSATELFLLTYDSLTSFDGKLEPAPDLAESWTVSADKLSWTFKLRKGVKWSDGQAFSSADVKFTYETVGFAGLGLYGDFLKGIVSVEAPDELTVVIKTEKPKANMLQNPTPILPEHIWKAGAKSLETFEDPSWWAPGLSASRNGRRGSTSASRPIPPISAARRRSRGSYSRSSRTGRPWPNPSSTASSTWP